MSPVAISPFLTPFWEMREHAGLKSLAEHWEGAKAAERANAQTYLIELSEALGVDRPQPAGSGYEFEFPIKVIARDGTEAQNFIDLYKEGHFLLEAKDAERLVALHDQRVSEELRGQVRWLRPEFQRRKVSNGAQAPTPSLELEEVPVTPSVPTPVAPWPPDAVGQITALRGFATEAPVSIERAMERFVGAKRELVERHLETLAILGEVQRLEDGRYVAFSMVG